MRASATDLADSHYDALQRRYPVMVTGDYERLVTASGNALEPVHRWFHVKEAYSHLLLERVIKDTGLGAQTSELVVHDPFAGSGTTLASAGDYARASGVAPVRASAVEANPFLHLLASVKGASYSEDRPPLLPLAKRIIAAISQGRVEPAAAPTLSTFGNREYFSEAACLGLQTLTSAIAQARTEDEDALALDALTVCVAAAVEPSSRLRRDGRALRFAPEKRSEDPLQVFAEKAHQMHADWSPVRGFSATVAHGDARDRGPGSDGSTDLVVFSPPYPNNIDYTEVYKLENWQLGFFRDSAEFSRQRHRTLRSHPSVRFERPYQFESTDLAEAVKRLIEPICAAVPESRYKASLLRTIRGYTDDMLDVVAESARLLRPGGHLVYVVGNSYHGGADGLVVAADLIIAGLAELCGLEVTCMDIARVPKRRRTQSTYLRETVVFARKP